MTIDQIIEQQIKEQVSLALDARMEEIASSIADRLSTPEYVSWGRYLTPNQAMTYTGYKSRNGFLEMCRSRGIKCIKVNSKSVRYDREELDRINIEVDVKDYLESFKKLKKVG